MSTCKWSMTCMLNSSSPQGRSRKRGKKRRREKREGKKEKGKTCKGVRRLLASSPNDQRISFPI